MEVLQKVNNGKMKLSWLRLFRYLGRCGACVHVNSCSVTWRVTSKAIPTTHKFACFVFSLQLLRMTKTKRTPMTRPWRPDRPRDLAAVLPLAVSLAVSLAAAEAVEAAAAASASSRW
jgi:hypothetical protein